MKTSQLEKVSITPLGRNVLINPEVFEETKKGVILPPNAKQKFLEQTGIRRGQVIRVGEEVTSVKENDYVAYNVFQPKVVEDNDVKLHIVDSIDIFCKIDI